MASGPCTLPCARRREEADRGGPGRRSSGTGEQTLTDTSVRDTWEITPDLRHAGRPHLGGNARRRAGRHPVELGLPPTTKLRAELHAMLVYGKGQFSPHQDSEKDDAMVGSLVVGLPSTFRGGELVVHHRGETSHTGDRRKRCLWWRSTATAVTRSNPSTPGTGCAHLQPGSRTASPAGQVAGRFPTWHALLGTSPRPP